MHSRRGAGRFPVRLPLPTNNLTKNLLASSFARRGLRILSKIAISQQLKVSARDATSSEARTSALHCRAGSSSTRALVPPFQDSQNLGQDR